MARQSFLTSEKTYTRKLREAVAGPRASRAEFSKDEILELYLNKVYFGAGLYGAEAAALGYFGKPAADLDIAQAALLAGLVKSPSAYAPTADLARATARRNLVLKVMRDSGTITRRRIREGRAQQVVLEDSLRRAEALRPVLQGSRPARAGRAVRLTSACTKAACKVYTTIDLEMQKAAEAEVAARR